MPPKRKIDSVDIPTSPENKRRRKEPTHVTLADIKEAAQILRKEFPYVQKTPLSSGTLLNGYNVRFKSETLQPNGSFKCRGAAVNMAQALRHDPAIERFVCASAGNHSQGFAMACQHLKVSGVIYMPKNTPDVKIQRTKKLGGEFVEIVLTGDTFDDAKNAAYDLVNSSNQTGQRTHFVDPFDDKYTIAGAGTIGLEISEQLGHAPDFIISAIGGGGLAAGISTFFAGSPTQCIGIQPEGAPSMLWQMHHLGKEAPLATIDTWVDGASVKKAGKLTSQALAANDVIATTVNKAQIIYAWQMLCKQGIVAELAGVLPVAALLNMPAGNGEEVVLVISGGNIDPARIAHLSAQPMPAQFPKTEHPLSAGPGFHFTRSVAQAFQQAGVSVAQ